MHPTLWGRAEAARTIIRQPAQAVAPLLFGVLADHALGGGHAGLQVTFLIMLVPLLAGACILLRWRRYYPRDLATAVASLERTQARADRSRAPRPAAQPASPPGG